MIWCIYCIKYTSEFFKGIYTSGNSRTAGWFARTSKRKQQINANMWWYYAYIKYTSVFFKGIYTSGNSRTAGLVRPNIQKKITDDSVHVMILCIYKVRKCIFQRNLYFRELTYRRTGSPEHLKGENMILVYMIWYYAYIMYTSVFFKGIYTSGNTRTARRVRPDIQKKITDYSVPEMILCIII